MSKQKLFLIVTGVLIVLLMPVTFMFWQYARKVIDVFMLHKPDYLITYEPLTFNNCKKYGNRATFNINYNGQLSEGRDGCIFAADSGDVVKVYFNKKDVSDNGIVWVLLRNCIIEGLAFIAMCGYIIYRVYSYNRLNI